jgi:hypothetical protein
VAEKEKIATAAFTKKFILHALNQGGPTFSSLGPGIFLPLGPRAKKPLLALFFFKTNTQFSLSLTTLIQK